MCVCVCKNGCSKKDDAAQHKITSDEFVQNVAAQFRPTYHTSAPNKTTTLTRVKNIPDRILRVACGKTDLSYFLYHNKPTIARI